MSRSRRRPFELSSTGLPDGRRVVMIVALDPHRVTFWICAHDAREALARVHGLGVGRARVRTWTRPLGACVQAAAEDPGGGVFRPDVDAFRNDGFLPLASFRDYFDRAH